MASDRPAARVLVWVSVAAFVVLAAALLSWPIVPHDTDLWYHLNFGRRIAETHSIPSGAWYSYVDTQPEFADYYWLCQLLFHALHQLLGFSGLIALRALLALATAGAVAGMLAHSALAKTSRGWAWAVGTFALLVIIERIATVRPHMFSYLGLACCLWLVERGGRAVFGLIPVALLWVNLHGVEYPVLVVVLGGAIAQAMWTRGAGEDKRVAIAAALALCMVFATPFGPGLLLVPFSELGLAGSAIFELRAVPWTALGDFGVQAAMPDRNALRALLLVCALIAAIDAVHRRELCIRHWVWLTAGVYLMLRSERLASEFALLALPAIGSSRLLGQVRLPLPGRAPALLGAALIAALALGKLVQLTRGPWPYPTAESFLPRGTSAFLRAHAKQGRVLHHPNYGGYLQWALRGDFRIGADLQTPFLFDPERVLAQASSFADPAAMRASLQRFKPDFILTPLNRWPAVEPALSAAFAPVAFDDSAVLYARRGHPSQLAERFELRTLTPARLGALLHNALPQAELPAARLELARLLQADGHVATTHAALAQLERQQGHEAAALRHATRAVECAPGHVEVLRVAGEVNLHARKHETALAHFEAALELLSRSNAPRDTRSSLTFGAASALSQLGRSDEAYAKIAAVFPDLTDSSVSALDLQLLSAAAADAGEAKTAAALTRLASQRRGASP